MMPRSSVGRDAPVPVAAPARRRALCIGVATFDERDNEHDTPQPLPFVADRVNALVQALRGFGYDCTTTDPDGRLTGGDLGSRVMVSLAAPAGDVVVVHVLSH